MTYEGKDGEAIKNLCELLTKLDVVNLRVLYFWDSTADNGMGREFQQWTIFDARNQAC